MNCLLTILMAASAATAAEPKSEFSFHEISPAGLQLSDAGKPVFVYNLLDLERYRWEGGVGGRDLFTDALKPGKHRIMFDFKYNGPGPGKGGTGVLTVDGKLVAAKTIPHTIPFLMAIDETFDIGSDTRTGVDDSYKLPFQFTGKIDKLTFNLGRSQLASNERQLMQHALERARD